MPSKPRSATSYALLGLLSIRPWTTYELTKQVRRSLSWFWPRAERKLYDEPKRLVEAGLATAVIEHTGKRPRTVYAITDDGRQALSDWLDEPPAPRLLEFEGMIKVFFADGGTREQLLSTLDGIANEATERLAILSEMAATQPAFFPRRVHLGALGLRLHHEQESAVLRWARWAHHQVESWPSASDPGAWDVRAELDRIAAGLPAGDVTAR